MGHIPVLLHEMLTALAPKDGEVYVDATFGGGGYTSAILEAADCQVIAIDRDPEAAQRAKALLDLYPGRFHFHAGTFSDLPEIMVKAGREYVDGVVFDFGVSSFQIDQAERGFSFRFEGPLDMRMSGEGQTAAEIVNTYSEENLADIIYQYGEERKSRRIAWAIVKARQDKPFETTKELADLIKATVKVPPTAQHPATLTFQALRIYVNNELIEINNGLKYSEKFLADRGRLVAVTFHSLEDRLVKSFIKERTLNKKKQSRLLPFEKPIDTPKLPHHFVDLYAKGLGPTDAEVKANPRSRSARLRAAVKEIAGD